MRLGHLNNHILPAFGHRALSSITEVELDNWLCGLPLATKTKNHIRDTLLIVWDEALRSRIIDQDYASRIDRFRGRSKTPDAFEVEDLQKLFPPDRTTALMIWGNAMYRAFFLVLATTGTRLGEARALTWGDWISNEEHFPAFVINKSVKHDLSIGSTKNGKPRVVPNMLDAAAALENWKKHAFYIRDEDLIFPNSVGRPIQGKACLEVFRRALAEARVDAHQRHLVIHSFRHSFNTILRPVLQDDRLRIYTGHSSQKMTDHYDHHRPEKDIAELQPDFEAINKTWKNIFRCKESA